MVKLGAENPLAPTATPLGDVKPHELIELLVTIPTGNVSVIVPVFAGILEETLNEIDADAFASLDT